MFLQGLILGFSIAAPVGPIGVLCIQRTLGRGRMHGFVSGLGAASADALYGAVAATGLSVVTAALLGLRAWLQLGGGLFLLWLGLRTVLARPLAGAAATRPERSGLANAFLSVFFLTMTNPATIISYLAVFAGLGVTVQAGGGASGLLVAGVFLGSAFWWLLLSFFTGLFRHRMTPAGLRVVNALAGLCLAALGLWSLVPLLLRRP